jgi:hypothetical protein
LPDLMRPSSVALEDSIQEIQSRTYSANSDGTPTMNQNSYVNELLAATMEPPPKEPPPKTPIKPADWDCVAGGGTGGPGTLINSPGSALHGYCVRMSKFPRGDGKLCSNTAVSEPGCGNSQNYTFGRYGNTKVGVTSPDGKYTSFGMDNPEWANEQRAHYRAAMDQYLKEGNKIVVLDTGGENCERTYKNSLGQFYCADNNGRPLSQFINVALNDKGEISEVEESRDRTFSEWNTLNNDERTVVSREVRTERGDSFCQWRKENLPAIHNTRANTIGMGCP